MEHFFVSFSEIEDRLKTEFPPVLYKYRDWNCSDHRKMISNTEVWLAHPKSLNDDMDIRVPLKFNYDEIHSSLFFDKLKKYAEQHNWFENLIPGSNDFFIACENKLEEIKENPIEYFKQTYNLVYNSELYDSIGIFSLTQNPLSRTMWAHYGNNSKGFCVGFNTAELFKDIMPISFRKVEYVNEPMAWSFVNAEREKFSESFYLKHTDWLNESEYRFNTPDIEKNQRVRKFRPTTIKEIFVGAFMPEKDLKELIMSIKNNLKSPVKLYKIVRDANSYEIGKAEIKF